MQEFEPIKEHETYKINKNGEVKNKNDLICNGTIANNGYVHITLDNKPYLLHRIVANQYLENTNNYEQVDHCDGCKTNNKLSNLRYVTKSQNDFNKNSCRGQQFEFIEELPNDSIEIVLYNNRYFKGYYWSALNQEVYFNNSVRIRKVHKTIRNSFYAQDISQFNTTFALSKLIKNKFNIEDK